MTHANRIVGAYGECVAARHAIAQGLVLLERNWRGPTGELDLVLADRATLVFGEVKTRRGLGFGLPAEAISPAKVRRMRRLAGQFMVQRRLRFEVVRFDLLSVLHRASGTEVDHLRQAF